ncbi:MAG: tol-pal system protein YbgF [Pseudohongiellaceae bacterium]|nr:tol-pal system protein YbgF [Pseudohongiellaceae bacterium]
MKQFLAAIAITVPAAVLSTQALGAAGIVEAQPYTPGQAPNGAQAGAGSNDALVMLLDQFREMRAELETLRGLVEEQRYDLRNLQRDSLDRYTDLDSRISALSESVSAAAVSTAVSAPPIPTTPMSSTPSASASTSATADMTGGTNATTGTMMAPSAPSTNMAPATAAASVSAPSNSIAPVEPTMLSEQQLYQLALDSLLQQQQYQTAITQFDQYLSLYPSGRFVTNAYYWKGQSYLNLAMLNEARDSFEVIVSQYPDGRKVDDAMYSLGTVYDKLGNTERAREYLRQVQSRFPNTSAANLADIYMRSMN